MARHTPLQEHVLYLLRGGGAHLDVESAFAGLPVELQGATIDGVPHSPWQLLEHMRICQWDILQYCLDPAHVSPEFPDGLWPQDPSPPTDTAWDESLAAFCADLEAMIRLVETPGQETAANSSEAAANPDAALLAQIPHAQPGHTLLREALLIADHNAYHLGQLVFLRRWLGAWEDEPRQPGATN